MPESPQPQELTFNQYTVLITTINTLRDELRQTTAQMNRLIEDHEERLRRNELLIVVGLFLIVLTAIVMFFVTRELISWGS